MKKIIFFAVIVLAVGSLFLFDTNRVNAVKPADDGLKEGDLIMTANALSGTDDRAYPDPFRVNFDRGPVPYNSLGNGPHKCIGQHLARLELRLFLEEWAKRMPIVRFDPAKPSPRSHAGPVPGVNHLHLAWD